MSNPFRPSYTDTVSGPNDEEGRRVYHNAIYSDDALRWDAEHGAPGPRRAAPLLLKLPTPELRSRADSEAHTLMNLGVAGIYSHGVDLAVRAILDLLEKGTPDTELYGERTAREYREREQELRKITGNPGAIYYPR